MLSPLPPLSLLLLPRRGVGVDVKRIVLGAIVMAALVMVLMKRGVVVGEMRGCFWGGWLLLGGRWWVCGTLEGG